MERTVHPDFQYFLEMKDSSLVDLFHSLRSFVLLCHPDANELLYRTQALSVAFSLSDKLTDAYCHIAIYNKAMNLGFNQGALLNDPSKLLKGTGKMIRHIAVASEADFQNDSVKGLVMEALEIAQKDMGKLQTIKAKSFSKIKI